MKIIETLTSEERVYSFVRDLWKTDVMKQAHDDSESYVGKIVRAFSKYPRIIAEMTEPKYEFDHFASWWHVLMLRYHYDNDMISDLYYLHEIFHISTMPHIKNIPFNKWYGKQVENEFQASMCSEVCIYFEIPSIRALSFDFEIWVDRYLQNEMIKNVWENAISELGESTALLHSKFPTGNYKFNEKFQTLSRKAFFVPIEQDRIKAMTAPDPFNWLELQISNYVKQNIDFANIWRKNYINVENHMAEFVKNVDDGIEEWDKLLKSHIQWLDTVSTDSIPFLSEAEIFSKTVHNNKKKYSNF